MNLGFEPRKSDSQVSDLNLYAPGLPWILNLVQQQLNFSLFFPQSNIKTFPIIYKECFFISHQLFSSNSISI